MNFVAKSVILGLTVFMSACAASRPPLTPEQLAMQQKFVDAFTAGIANRQHQQVQPAAAPVAPAAPVITEAELAQKVNALPVNAPSTWSLITDGVDGFNINGQAFVSPRGRVVSYGADEKSGRIVYISQESRTSHWVAMVHADRPWEAVPIGQVTKQYGAWRFTSATGQVLNGDQVFATSQGVMVVRSNAGFHYVAGRGTSSFTVADGFHVAPFQPGDIGGTKHILLERNAKNGNELVETFGKA